LTVDIVTKREASHKVITKSYLGPYTGDDMLHPEFNALVGWARRERVKTGKWLRIELDKYEIGVPSSQRRWWACIELKGRTEPKPPSGIELKVLPAEFVASVTFDPAQVSSRLVYHGLECWLDWRTKFHEYEEAGPTREMYIGNPWTDADAKKRIEVQVPIRRMERE
jgi:hypothetical protein